MDFVSALVGMMGTVTVTYDYFTRGVHMGKLSPKGLGIAYEGLSKIALVPGTVAGTWLLSEILDTFGA